jgi:hypothetical protein
MTSQTRTIAEWEATGEYMVHDIARMWGYHDGIRDLPQSEDAYDDSWCRTNYNLGWNDGCRDSLSRKLEVPAPGNSAPDLAASLRDLRGHIEDGNVAAARRICEAVFSARPEFVDESGHSVYLTESLRLALAAGQLDDAERAAVALRGQLAASDPLVEVLYARHYARHGDRDGARAQWQAALDRNPALEEAKVWLKAYAQLAVYPTLPPLVHSPTPSHVNGAPDHKIQALNLPELVSTERLLATNNASGVLDVHALAGPGSYARPAPRAMNTVFLEEDLRGAMRQILLNTEQAYGPLCAVTFKDAHVVGQGSVVTRDNYLIRDSALEFLAGGRVPDGFTQSPAGELAVQCRSLRHIEGPALLLKRPWWRNYGHWLIDSAALFALIARTPMPRDCKLIVGKQGNPAMRKLVMESLTAIAHPVFVLEHPDDERWCVQELIYPAPVHVPPLFKHPDGLAALRDSVLRKSDGAMTAGRRLYVTRGNHPARRLVNEDDVIALARKAGFEVVRPELYSLREQASLFRSAEYVVGVKGAALANLIFCRPGASVLVLSPGDFVDPFFWDLSAHAGMQYSELFGKLVSHDKPRSHNAFEIDLDAFAAILF